LIKRPDVQFYVAVGGIVGGALLTIFLDASAAHWVGRIGRRDAWEVTACSFATLIILYSLVRALRHRINGRDELEIAIWATNQWADIHLSLPAGAYEDVLSSDRHLQVGDFYKSALYISPRFIAKPTPATTNDMFEYVRYLLNVKWKAIIRADPGDGKSLFMQLLYLQLLDELKDHPRSARIPLLIPLDRLDPDSLQDSHLRSTLINSYAHELCQVPSALVGRVQEARFALLLDGLDELIVQTPNPDIAAYRIGNVVTAADVLTSRDTFFQLRVTGVAARVGEHLTFKPLDFDQDGPSYIRKFCQLLGGDAERAIAAISNDSSLRDLFSFL